MEDEVSVEINRPINVVFEGTRKGIASLTVTKYIEGRPEGVGSTFHCVFTVPMFCGVKLPRFRHGPLDFWGVVTRYEPSKLMAVHLTGYAYDVDAEFRLDDLGGKTRLTQRRSVTPKFFFLAYFLKAFCFLFGRMSGKLRCMAMKSQLNKLKRLLEKSADQTPR
jgi:hypothetical protein